MKVFCFGSRARGDFQKYSDLDLLLETTDDLSSIVGEINEKLIDSNLPYKVDIVCSNNIANSYRAQIEKEKVLF